MIQTQAFAMANQELSAVIHQIKPDQWDIKIPEGMSWTPNQALSDMVNYHTYDDAWVPDVLAGKTKAEVGEQYEALLSSPNVIAAYDTYNPRAIKAVEAFSEPQKQVHLSYGDFSAQDFLTHIIIFRGLRIHDIARLIDSGAVISDQLVQILWDLIEPQAEYLREMHVFAAKIEIPEDAPLIDRLMGLTGRQP